MADPATTKVTLVSLIGATVVGGAAELLVEWMGVIVGAGVGGMIACSLSEELSGKPFSVRFGHWGLAALVGAIAAPVAMLAVNRVFGPLEAGAGLSVLPFVSMMAGGFWRTVARDVPDIWAKWRGKK